jgi:hypothetical protein
MVQRPRLAVVRGRPRLRQRSPAASVDLFGFANAAFETWSRPGSSLSRGSTGSSNRTMGSFAPVGSDGFFPRSAESACFDQQPIEACATVSACLDAWRVTGDEQWGREMWRAFSWFLGENQLQTSLYDPMTKGCLDGLHVDRPNENQGAESTLSFLIALAEMGRSTSRCACATRPRPPFQGRQSAGSRRDGGRDRSMFCRATPGSTCTDLLARAAAPLWTLGAVRIALDGRPRRASDMMSRSSPPPIRSRQRVSSVSPHVDTPKTQASMRRSGSACTSPKLFECASDFDLIHNSYDFLPLSYSRLIGTPVVTTIHGFSSERILPVYQEYAAQQPLRRRSARRTEHPSLEYAATIHHGIDMMAFATRSRVSRVSAVLRAHSSRQGN